MSKSTNKIAQLTRLSLMIALLAILTFTPLGFIPLPFASVTIIHLPVLVIAILFGYGEGVILGAAFGLMSLWRATVGSVALTDMMFSPFLSGKPLQSLIMVLVPRILLGLIAAGLFQFFKNKMHLRLAIGLTALIATLLHSVMVLGLLSVFFDALPLKELFVVVLGANGLIEMALAVVVTVALCPVLMKARGTRNRSK